MHFLLSALGSAGDVHPFIAIGQALRARGHAVTLIASPPFAERVRAAGIAFAPLGAPGDFERVVARAELWDPRRGTRLLVDELLGHLEEAYVATAAAATPESVLVGSTLSWGMRLLQDRTGQPGATIHLSPVCIQSAERPPRLPGIGDLAWLPVRARRWLQRAGERWILDRWFGPRLNRVRASLGLAPVTQIWSRWMHAPDLVIAAWPDWFAPAQADWPPQARTTGFPLFAEDSGAWSIELEDFLTDGPAPIGITPGSAMAHGDAFFARAIEACEALQRRALLITPYRAQLPAALPPSMRHVDYAPFARLLPRLAALVHHGGIGTSARALAAGRPQLVVPFAHDQFDNAARLVRQGVARSLATSASTRAWIDALDALSDASAVREATRRDAERMAHGRPAAEEIADRLAALGESGSVAGRGR